MKDFLIPLVIMFLTSLAIIETLLYAYRTTKKSNPSKVRKRLKGLQSAEIDGHTPSILRRRVMSNIPTFNEMLKHAPGIRNLDTLIIQADASYPPGVFILLAAVLGLSGFFIPHFLLRDPVIAVLIAAACAMLPFVYLSAKKRKRMHKFDKQLPEGLGLIARALKAGHAFTSGMQLAADQFEDPLGTEFAATIDEINFGVSVPDALKNLSRRVDCHDLRYFVVSVILQRETGGNLAEILENIARLIRERFKFQDKLKTLSAEGRYSAVVLGLLPFLVFVAIYYVNPKYIMVLINEPVGTIMIIIAAVMMGFGAVAMKNVVNIKV